MFKFLDVKDYGIKIHDQTPQLENKNPYKREFNRTHEIFKFIQDYKENNKNKNIKNWIAIDDIDLYKLNNDFKNHFVKTIIKDGLTEERAKLALKLLNSA